VEGLSSPTRLAFGTLFEKNPSVENPSVKNPPEKNPPEKNPSEKNPSEKNPSEKNPSRLASFILHFAGSLPC